MLGCVNPGSKSSIGISSVWLFLTHRKFSGPEVDAVPSGVSAAGTRRRRIFTFIKRKRRSHHERHCPVRPRTKSQTSEYVS